MIQLGELGIELKSGILFSVIALVLSIIAGLAGSVPLIMVLFRGLIITPVFFIIGYGMVLVVKNFVPELYEIHLNLKVPSVDSSENLEISPEVSDSFSEEVSEKNDSGFSEFTEKDYDRLQTTQDSDLTKMQSAKESDLNRMQAAKDSDLNSLQTVKDSGLDNVLHTSSTKLGKHIIQENQMNSYEPKLMAQAVRTMMSKDKD